jgi:hypothetical protein
MRYPPISWEVKGASEQICKDDVNGLPPLRLLNVNPFVSSLLTGKNPRLLLELKYTLKVHKRENFLGSDIEICTFSLLVIINVLFKKKFCWTIIGGDRIVLRIMRLRRMKFFL